MQKINSAMTQASTISPTLSDHHLSDDDLHHHDDYTEFSILKKNLKPCEEIINCEYDDALIEDIRKEILEYQELQSSKQDLLIIDLFYREGSLLAHIRDLFREVEIMGFRCKEYLDHHKHEDNHNLIEFEDGIHIVNNTFEEIENHRERFHGKDVLFIIDPRWKNHKVSGHDQRSNTQTYDSLMKQIISWFIGQKCYIISIYDSFDSSDNQKTLRNFLTYHHETTCETFFSSFKYEIGHFDYSKRLETINSLEKEQRIVLSTLKRMSLLNPVYFYELKNELLKEKVTPTEEICSIFNKLIYQNQIYTNQNGTMFSYFPEVDYIKYSDALLLENENYFGMRDRNLSNSSCDLNIHKIGILGFTVSSLEQYIEQYFAQQRNPFRFFELLTNQNEKITISQINDQFIHQTKISSDFERTKVLYQNPFDAILSLFRETHLETTSMDISYEFVQQNWQLWDTFVKDCSLTYFNWIEQALKSNQKIEIEEQSEHQNQSILFFSLDQVSFISTTFSHVEEQIFDQNSQTLETISCESYLSKAELINKLQQSQLEIPKHSESRDMRTVILRGLHELEHSNNKQGVYFFQLRDYINQKYLHRKFEEAHFPMDIELCKIVRSGQAFINSEGEQFSFYPSSEFKGIRELAPKIYPRAKSFSQHLEFLYSDGDDNCTAPWQTAFLDGQEKVDQVLFASFPRSGNSMIRQHLQDISGIYTGDLVPLEYACDFQLELKGLDGCGIYDNSTWVVKTHVPIDPFMYDYSANKVVFCLRNPYDVVISRLSFACSWLHTQKISAELTEKNIKAIIKYGRESLIQWCDYHQYWINVQKSLKTPVVFYRYEDILKNPDKTYRDAFSFMIGKEVPKGSVLDKRLQSFEQLQHRVYEKKGGKGLSIYRETLQGLKDEYLIRIQKFFGYTPDGKVASFSEGEEPEFMKMNKQVLEHFKSHEPEYFNHAECKKAYLVEKELPEFLFADMDFAMEQ